MTLEFTKKEVDEMIRIFKDVMDVLAVDYHILCVNANDFDSYSSLHRIESKIITLSHLIQKLTTKIDYQAEIEEKLKNL